MERSQKISGTEILNVFDVVCKYLQVRSICLKDTSIIMTNSGDLDMRVLYVLAGGNTWLNRKGYNKFVKGRFGVEAEEYRDAKNSIRAMDLNSVYVCLRETNVVAYKRLRKIVLDLLNRRMLEGELILRNVVLCLLSLRDISKKVAGARRLDAHEMVTVSRGWSHHLICRILEDVVQVLSLHPGGLSREQLRGETLARRVKNTGLVDHVVSKVKNVIVATGDRFYVIIWEKSLRGYSTVAVPNPAFVPVCKKLEADIKFLIQDVGKELLEYEYEVVDRASFFVKDFPYYNQLGKLTFVCQFLSPWSGSEDYSEELPPGVVVSLSPASTVLDLKIAAEKALRERM